MNIVQRRRTAPRGGAVLLTALLCLVIIAAILGHLLHGSLQQRRQLHAERDRRQCEWLLEAGIERAKTLRAKDDAYRGETWKLSADEKAGLMPAQVTIEWSSEGDTRTLQVIATYPLVDDAPSVRRSRKISFPHKST